MRIDKQREIEFLIANLTRIRQELVDEMTLAGTEGTVAIACFQKHIDKAMAKKI